MDSSANLHCLGGSDGGAGGGGISPGASQPSSPVPPSAGSSSLSSAASAYPPSPLSASGANAKKRGRGANAGKAGGGGGTDCGRLAEAMRLLQSGKLPKLDPSEETVKEEYEKYVLFPVCLQSNACVDLSL